MYTFKKSKDFRNEAFLSLKKDYWGPFLICLIFMALSGGINFSLNIDIDFNRDPFFVLPKGFLVLFSISSVLSIALFIFLGGPLSYGKAAYFLYFVDGKDGKRNTGVLFSGFQKQYFKRVELMALIVLKVFLWSLLFIVPGIIKALSFSQAFNIMAENDNLSASECISDSTKMMDGYKKNLFILNLSFIWWYLLSIITFGIGFIFLNPYLTTTNTYFYRFINKKNGDIIEANATFVN